MEVINENIIKTSQRSGSLPTLKLDCICGSSVQVNVVDGTSEHEAMYLLNRKCRFKEGDVCKRVYPDQALEKIKEITQKNKRFGQS